MYVCVCVRARACVGDHIFYSLLILILIRVNLCARGVCACVCVCVCGWARGYLLAPNGKVQRTGEVPTKVRTCVCMCVCFCLRLYVCSCVDRVSAFTWPPYLFVDACLRLNSDLWRVRNGPGVESRGHLKNVTNQDRYRREIISK